MYAVKKNDETVIDLLLSNLHKKEINFKGQDKAGKSVIHYVV